MFPELEKYQQKGQFTFKTGDSLRMVSKGVPNKQGVYYILQQKELINTLVYIGKSGTINQDGTYKEQLLRQRINNTFKGMKREAYFKEVMIKENIPTLEIRWFVTMNNEYHDIPGYVEAVLMQQYFSNHGQLPPWNNCF